MNDKKLKELKTALIIIVSLFIIGTTLQYIANYDPIPSCNSKRVVETLSKTLSQNANLIYGINVSDPNSLSYHDFLEYRKVNTNKKIRYCHVYISNDSGIASIYYEIVHTADGYMVIIR